MNKQSSLIKALFSLFILLLLAACGGRDISLPEQALIGHWETEYADIYHTQDKLISVLKEDGSTMESGYEIISSDEENRTIIIVTTSDAEDVTNFAEVVQFNEDYTKASVTISLEHSRFTEFEQEIFANLDQEELDANPVEMVYIDDKQQP